MTRQDTRPLVLFAALISLLPARALAHSAEQGFILLLPTDIYITAGTLTVVATILLVPLLGTRISTLYARSVPSDRSASGLNWISLVSGAVLLGLFWIGITGPRDPLSNLLPLTIWTIWWIGFVTCLPVTGNIWKHLNPWSGAYRLLAGSKETPYKLPKQIGIWPGVVIFLMFHIFAIADIAPSDPLRLATIAAGYWVFTLCGMMVFGERDWLIRAECFTILFTLIASLALIHQSRTGPPGWAAFRPENISAGHAAFCIIMLGAGSFDGLHETFWWLAQIGINPLEFPGRSAVVWTSTFGLIVTCVALGTAFILSVWVGLKLANDQNVDLSRATKLFALSLIPIAFGYHFAHYLTSFLVGAQYSAIVLSDPFATGANLFGTANFQVTTGFLSDPGDVKLIWFTQAAAVVLSHILAVVMAHGAASKLFKTHKQIVLSQIALSALMVAYTVFGLWLLASPRGV